VGCGAHPAPGHRRVELSDLCHRLCLVGNSPDGRSLPSAQKRETPPMEPGWSHGWPGI